jgi:uncharacterized protein (DUF608 family)
LGTTIGSRKCIPWLRRAWTIVYRLGILSLKGVVEEPHHNTYDIEFWGPDGMCTSFYLGALTAVMEMGKHLKLKKDVEYYQKLYDKGKKFIETELYNGEYFYQKITVEGLNAPNPIEASAKSMGGEYSEEARKLLEKEGPKYQFGTGCLSDGVLGAWIASVCGLPTPFDAAKITSHLQAVHKHNFKSDLSEHANPQRPSFAMGKKEGCCCVHGQKEANFRCRLCTAMRYGQVSNTRSRHI